RPCAARRARDRRNRALVLPVNELEEFSNEKNRDCPYLRGFALFGAELAVAVERSREVATHGFARGFRIAGGDGLGDAAMLFLDDREVSAPTAHALGQSGHRAARDQVSADELQETRELGVAGRLGDGAVERKVFV